MKDKEKTKKAMENAPEKNRYSDAELQESKKLY